MISVWLKMKQLGQTTAFSSLWFHLSHPPFLGFPKPRPELGPQQKVLFCCLVGGKPKKKDPKEAKNNEKGSYFWGRSRHRSSAQGSAGAAGRRPPAPPHPPGTWPRSLARRPFQGEGAAWGVKQGGWGSRKLNQVNCGETA